MHDGAGRTALGERKVTHKGKTSFVATEANARKGIGVIMARLAAEGLPAETLGSVEIVLAEAVNNIVEHAYCGVAPGDVQVTYAVTPDALTMTFVDHGAAFPHGILPPGRPADLSVSRESLPEGGFGWLLIRELTNDLTYDRHNGYNKLSVRFDLIGASR